MPANASLRPSHAGKITMHSGEGQAASPIDFAAPNLLHWLAQATPAQIDALPIGVITMLPDTTVTHYNACEASLSGLTPARVVGRKFFSQVAPCANNPMVADRFAAVELDATIDYVFTFKLAPKKVRLRLLKHPAFPHIYLVVQQRN